MQPSDFNFQSPAHAESSCFASGFASLDDRVRFGTLGPMKRQEAESQLKELTDTLSKGSRAWIVDTYRSAETARNVCGFLRIEQQSDRVGFMNLHRWLKEKTEHIRNIYGEGSDGIRYL